jgi:Septum formation initiator
MPIRPLFWLGGAVVMAAVVAALFVLPVRDWFAQDEALAEKRSELAVLERTNAELAAANARLQTDDGVREAAREEIGYVKPGEQRQTVMPVPQGPATLPTGWPYDTISQIIAVRSAVVPVP